MAVDIVTSVEWFSVQTESFVELLKKYTKLHTSHPRPTKFESQHPEHINLKTPHFILMSRDRVAF